MHDRHIERAWVEATVAVQDWSERDPDFPERTHSYKVIPEFGGRVLRVVHFMSDDDIVVITAHFDRSARRRRRQ
jgi:hypothetical protein